MVVLLIFMQPSPFQHRPNHTGWLGVKHQVTYLPLPTSAPQGVTVSVCSPIKNRKRLAHEVSDTYVPSNDLLHDIKDRKWYSHVFTTCFVCLTKIINKVKTCCEVIFGFIPLSMACHTSSFGIPLRVCKLFLRALVHEHYGNNPERIHEAEDREFQRLG